MPGDKVVSAVVNGAVSIVATATVTVTAIPPQPDHLEFLVQPTNTESDEPISPAVEVAIVDEDGSVVPLSDVEIEIELIREDGRRPQVRWRPHSQHRRTGSPSSRT